MGFPGFPGPQGAPTVAIGGAVSGGTATRVLFVDSSGNLAGDADMTFATDTLTVTKVAITAAGTAAAPALLFSNGGSVCGFFLGAGNALNFSAGSSDVMRIFSSNLELANGTILRFGGFSGAQVDWASEVFSFSGETSAQEIRLFGRYSDASNYVRADIKCSVTAVTAAAGATITATGAIPARVGRIIGVATKVTTALGTGSGTTGYTVGDGSDADLWGSVTGTATTTSTDRDSYTADPIPAWSATAQDIVLTATGGNFDGTGVITVYVYFIDVQAD